MFFLNGQFILSIICIGVILSGFYLVVSNLKIKKTRIHTNQLLLAIMGTLLVIVGSYCLFFTLFFRYS